MDRYSIINFRYWAIPPLTLGIILLAICVFLSPEIMSVVFLHGLIMITGDRYLEVYKFKLKKKDELQV